MDRHAASHAMVMHLPDLLEGWPWKRKVNPFYEEVARETSEWIHSFDVFDEKSRAAFGKCRFSLLAAHFYPDCPREQFRVGSDFMSYYFVIDHHTDEQSSEEVRHYAEIVIDALRHVDKPRPPGENIVGEMSRQFGLRYSRNSTAQAYRHFLRVFKHYLDTVVEQAQDRDEDKYRTVEEYCKNRLHNIGAVPSFAVLVMPFSIPDDVFNDPDIQKIEILASAIIFYGNDIVSYNREQAVGDDRHNLVTVLMHNLGLTLNEAVAWIASRNEEDKRAFLETHREVMARYSSDSELDKAVRTYVDGIGAFIRGSDCWNFEMERYFGTMGSVYRTARQVELWPKVSGTPLVPDVDTDIKVQASSRIAAQ
ncbi:hypothetical protein VTK73DRAFT_8668 [Phialemonium thermophilum]|uniref:Terpene synthase n=1 Tax=Phialemonium thermophilum TaxID=223376 RepID=A0ABR3XN20_9PEZI